MSITIPPEALEAGAIELAPHPWSMYTEAAQDKFRGKARAAIAAALEAWPGIRKPMRVNGLQSECWLELPLPQEGGDE